MESSAEVVCGVGASRASKPNFAEMSEMFGNVLKCLKKIAFLCAHHHVLTHCIINIIIIQYYKECLNTYDAHMDENYIVVIARIHGLVEFISILFTSFLAARLEVKFQNQRLVFILLSCGIQLIGIFFCWVCSEVDSFIQIYLAVTLLATGLASTVLFLWLLREEGGNKHQVELKVTLFFLVAFRFTIACIVVKLRNVGVMVAHGQQNQHATPAIVLLRRGPTRSISRNSPDDGFSQATRSDAELASHEQMIELNLANFEFQVRRSYQEEEEEKGEDREIAREQESTRTKLDRIRRKRKATRAWVDSDSPTDKNENEEAELACSICLEELERNSRDNVALVCSHVFHRDCVKHWIATHSNCPVCRHRVDSFG